MGKVWYDADWHCDVKRIVDQILSSNEPWFWTSGNEISLL